MVSDLSAWCVRRPIPILVAALVMVFLGAESYGQRPVTDAPTADRSTFSITVVQPGAEPSDLDARVGRPIENAVSRLVGVRHVLSRIESGVSTTRVEFEPGPDADHGLGDLKDVLASLTSSLPPDAQAPVIQRLGSGVQPCVTYAVALSGQATGQASRFVDTVVAPALRALPGVGRVDPIGEGEREVAVSLDHDRLRALGLTVSDVTRQLRGTGFVDVGDLARTAIGLSAGGTIRLDDLATIVESPTRSASFASLDGKPMAGVRVMRLEDADERAVAARVATSVASLLAAHPDLTLTLVTSSATPGVEDVEAAFQMAFCLAGAASLILIVGLRDLRAAGLASFALVASIAPVFWAMEGLGYSLNGVSALAIALGTAIVADDAIVAIETIDRHRRIGHPPFEASVLAMRETGASMWVGTGAFVASLLPLGVLGGVSSPLLKPFAVVMAIALLSSLLVATCVVPALAAYGLTPRANPSAPAPAVTGRRFYDPILGWCVAHYPIAVALGLVVLIGLMLAGRSLPVGFTPLRESGRSMLGIDLPPGSSASESRSVVETIARQLRKRPDVSSVFAEGGNGLAGPERASAILIIGYTPKSERKTTQSALERLVAQDLRAIGDIRFRFLGESAQRKVRLIARGQDAERVGVAADAIAAQMRDSALFDHIVPEVSLGRAMPRIRTRPDAVARLGVPADRLSDTLAAAEDGLVVSSLRPSAVQGRSTPVRIQLDARTRGSQSSLEQVRVPLPPGRAQLPLASIADVALEQSPMVIARYDGEAQAAVDADLVGTAGLAEAMATIDSLPAVRAVPAGISIVRPGDAERSMGYATDRKTGVRNALLIVGVLMVFVFGRVLQPVSIVLAMPLAIGGAFLGLLVTKTPLSVPVFFGSVLIVAFVTKTTTLLLGLTVRAIDAGVPRDVAVLQSARKRARPVLMTSLALVVGLLPAAFRFGAEGDLTSPMAIAIIGGVIASSVLCLTFAPALFLIMDDLGTLAARLLAPIVVPSALRHKPSQPWRRSSTLRSDGMPSPAPHAHEGGE